MSRWLDEEMSEEKLEPMPPPPAPQAPSHAHPILRTHRRTRYNDAGDGDELLTPQSPPIPHTHPLVALSDESARNVKLQQEAGGMAIHSSQKLFRHRRSIASGKRLDPTFLNRARVEAFTERGAEEPQESDNPFAVETEHSSRAIALQMQRQAEELNKAPVLVPLDEEEWTVAATEASARRRELVQAARQAARECRWAEEDGENDGAVMNGDISALARASERKVRKQLNAKWVQSRQDPSNRPKGPLERPEERGLRETLFRTTASDLLRSGVLYDEADAARNATFGSMRRSQLPVITSGIVGLAGCCFEKYEC